MLTATEEIIQELPDCREIEITVRDKEKVIARSRYLNNDINSLHDAMTIIEDQAQKAGYDPLEIEFENI